MATRTAGKAIGTVLLDEYSAVRLRHSVEVGGVTYPAGCRDVIVHRLADGIGYEVEFEEPAFRIITLTGSDIQPDHEFTGASTAGKS
jgi:hypothetical protein